MGKCLNCKSRVLGDDVETCNNCHPLLKKLIKQSAENPVNEYEEQIYQREQSRGNRMKP